MQSCQLHLIRLREATVVAKPASCASCLHRSACSVAKALVDQASLQDCRARPSCAVPEPSAGAGSSKWRRLCAASERLLFLLLSRPAGGVQLSSRCA